MAVHVWKDASPADPFDTKQTGKQSIQEGLDELKKQGQKILYVWGKDKHNQPLTYNESIKIPIAGIDIMGIDYPTIAAIQGERTVEFLSGQKDPTRITGFTVTKGYHKSYGAGLFAEDSAVIVEGNCIVDNQTEGRGGGICLRYTSAEAEKRRSWIVSNKIYRNKAQH